MSLTKSHFILVFSALIALGSFISFELKTAETTDLKAKPKVDVEKTVRDLLAKMTLEEKVQMISGVDEFYLPGIARLGIPKLKMGDGPMGVRNWGPSTLYPATMLLGATWNEELAAEFGTALGKDSRARGMHISLAPGVNIYRSPLCGRNFEYMGEDPFLTSILAVASIKAVQAQGVAATVKHFAANNSEVRRSFISNEIDERTLREIYLPAFEAAVKEGNVQCIMNAYNLLNGEYCTANKWLNKQILKGEWGFKGVVMSDWRATHDTESAALGGLDLEMPGAEFFAPEKLIPLLKNGKVPMADLDDKVRRILRMIVANNWMDTEQHLKAIPLDDPNSAATALKIAEEGITLLKNEGNVLPLTPTVKSIVVVGPNATPIVSGLGSSRVTPFHSVGFLEGLQQLKSAKVSHVKWEEPYQFFKNKNYASAIKQEIYTSRKQNKLITQSTTEVIGMKWDAKSPSLGLTSKDQAFARYITTISPAKTGSYQFVLNSRDMNVDVWINGEKKWTSVRECKGSFVIRLNGATNYKIVVEAEQRKKDRSFQLEFGWGDTAPLISAQDAELIKKADLIVACVGFNSITGEGEGADRTYELPGRQEELILDVSKLNPKTVVVLNTGGSVATENWIAKVPALIHSFYPGQEGGVALAKIITGVVNPSGKLPFSYEKKWEDCAAYANYPKSDDMESTKMVYKEGIFIGYRWFDAKNIPTLFPFGHGLSYTTYKYSNLKVDKQGENVKVTMDISNIGKRAGAEVLQLYVGQKKASSPRPVRELKGFKKIALQPNETKQVTFLIDKKAFSYFHPIKKQWIVEADQFTIEIGASSKDIRLNQTIAYN